MNHAPASGEWRESISIASVSASETSAVRQKTARWNGTAGDCFSGFIRMNLRMLFISYACDTLT